MFRWFETRIDAFPEDPPARPPDTLLAFYAYFIKPVWPVFAVLLVAGFLGSLIEVSLLAFVGSLVDMMKTAPNAGSVPRQPLAHPAVDGVRGHGRPARRVDRCTT